MTRWNKTIYLSVSYRGLLCVWRGVVEPAHEARPLTSRRQHLVPHALRVEEDERAALGQDLARRRAALLDAQRAAVARRPRAGRVQVAYKRERTPAGAGLAIKRVDVPLVVASSGIDDEGALDAGPERHAQRRAEPRTQLVKALV